MKIEVAFLLVIPHTCLKCCIALMGFEHTAQFRDVFIAHAFCSQTAGHAFKGFANFVELNQFFMAQGHNPRAHMRHPHQQALTFKTVDRLAQRPATDAVGAGQLRLGNFATRRNIALDDSGLNTPEDVLGQGFRVILGQRGTFERIQHIVDTLKINSVKISYSRPYSQRINKDCRQSTNKTLVESTATDHAPNGLGAGVIKPSC